MNQSTMLFLHTY